MYFNEFIKFAVA